MTFLLYVGAGCSPCKAGFTQQDLTSVWVTWVACEWCMAFFKTVVKKQGMTAKSTDTNTVMSLCTYSMDVQCTVWQ